MLPLLFQAVIRRQARRCLERKSAIVLPTKNERRLADKASLGVLRISCHNNLNY